MKRALYFLSGLLVFSAFGCQKGGGSSSAPTATAPTAAPTPAPETTATFIKTYEFREFGGCTTGFHQLRTQQDYCNALLNEALNNSCALDMRQNAYSTECNSNLGGNIGSGVTNQTLITTGSAAYCYMVGQDQEARGLFDNRQASNQRFISWDGKKSQRFNLSALLPAKYGRVHLNLTPAQGSQPALGEILVSQGRLKYSESSQFNSRLIFQVNDLQGQKKISIECLPEASFTGPAMNLNHIQCQVNKDRPVDISWNAKSRLSTSLKVGNVKNLTVSLYPPQGENEAQIEISISGIEAARSVLGRAAVRAGLAIKHVSLPGTQVQVRCSAASN